MSSQQSSASPTQIVASMMARDYHSQWLGLQIEQVDYGYCKLNFRVRRDMLNGFATIHGGMLFAASDSAFAFACNSYGNVTVALDVNISYVRPAKEGEQLTVEAKELHRGNRTGFYEVKCFNESGELVSIFKGTAYQTSKQHEVQ
ncbi:MAG TPA: hydroxyphenylacetyl-CoA thioesterase PaaI [Flavobacteriales bacterium]